MPQAALFLLSVGTALDGDPRRSKTASGETAYGHRGKAWLLLAVLIEAAAEHRWEIGMRPGFLERT